MDFGLVTTNCLRWGCGPVGRVLACHIQGPGSPPALYEADLIMHACYANTQEIDARGSRVQGHLLSELHDTLSQRNKQKNHDTLKTAYNFHVVTLIHS